MALFLGAMALFLPGCGEQLPTYRYRLTVEVDTPEGVRTGSSVIEVRSHVGAGFPGPEAASLSSRIRGEAVAVDLGRRGVLFGLLSGQGRQAGANGYAWALLPNPPATGSGNESLRTNYRALGSVRGRAELSRDQYPTLIAFLDPRDPLTVEEIDPDDLGARFGDGVRLRGVSVEITRDDVTSNIVARLPWLTEHPERRLDPNFKYSASPNLSQRLSHGDLQQGN